MDAYQARAEVDAAPAQGDEVTPPQDGPCSRHRLSYSSRVRSPRR